MNTNRMVSVVVLVGLVGLTLSVAGCKTFSSPSGVLEIALEGLQERNLDQFKSTLYGTALAEYGSDQGMDRLRQRFAAYMKLEAANQQKISTVMTGPAQWLDTSTVDILGSSLENEEAHILVGTATTLCWSKRVKVRRPKSRTEIRRITDCRISEFK